MHKISVHYKNTVAGTSGLQLRWQSRAAGHLQAFSSAFSGIVPAEQSTCNNGAYSSEYCRLGSVMYQDGSGSSQVAGLYSMQYIKFTSPTACNGRWTRIGRDNSSTSASDTYDPRNACVRFSSSTWRDGFTGCTCSQSDQFKLVEWLGLPGTVRLSSQCVNDGHAEFASLDAEVSLTSTFISLKPTDVTRMRIVVGNYVRIDDEILKITNVSLGTLTVTREQAQTTAKVHRLGAIVFALSQVALEDVGVPSPDTTFASHLIRFTTGACTGRWANITIYDAAEQCVELGGTMLGGGYNWLDAKGACTVSEGDRYLIKWGVDATGATNTSGAAGALSTETWLSTVGTLQAHSAKCPLGARTVRLGASAPKKDNFFENTYVRFTSGRCDAEWARVVSYAGASQCATLEWESLGTGSASGQKTSVSSGAMSTKNITELDTVLALFSDVQAAIDIKAGSYIQLDSEIMLVTGIVSSTKITVERAQEVLNLSVLPEFLLYALLLLLINLFFCQIVAW
jgi:hypothetical protein